MAVFPKKKNVRLKFIKIGERFRLCRASDLLFVQLVVIVSNYFSENVMNFLETLGERIKSRYKLYCNIVTYLLPFISIDYNNSLKIDRNLTCNFFYLIHHSISTNRTKKTVIKSHLVIPSTLQKPRVIQMGKQNTRCIIKSCNDM